MKIAFCSSEVFPFAKTGGLADVCGALAPALASAGCSIKIFMPLYKDIKPEKSYDGYGVSRLGEAEIIFIRRDDYFYRENLYGDPRGDYPDNLERFTFFSRRIMEFLERAGFVPDIIHCNDWQTAMVIVYLKTVFRGGFFRATKSLLTIHNLAYQGIFPKNKFLSLGISDKYFSPGFMEFYGKINLLKGGIVFSDIVNTVSPTYSKQIQTKEYGCGLEGVLRDKSKDLYGILNAVDYTAWNPEDDPYIYENFSPRDLKSKKINKKKFQKELGFKLSEKEFLVGVVSRLSGQKGVDILSESAEKILEKAQMIILGFGDEKYHDILGKKARKFKTRFSLNLMFDEALAHKIYASCDAFLMPSLFEPCGLAQMISYKYATIPVVHNTGGLTDTVIDYDKNGGGFVFHDYSRDGFVSAVNRAWSVFNDKTAWEKLMGKVSRFNFSWKLSAAEYLKLYYKLVKSG